MSDPGNGWRVISDRNDLQGELYDLAGSFGFAGPWATPEEQSAALERATDRVMAMSHPNWGDNWDQWLSTISNDEFFELGRKAEP